MNISINKEDLLTPLQYVIGAVEKKQTMPILGNVLLSSSGKELRIIGTDRELELNSCIQLEQAADIFTTLPARKLLDICKALPNNSIINLEIEENRTILKSAKSRFTLSTLPATDFPILDEVDFLFKFKVKQKDFKKLLDKTSFAMAQQDVRYYLNGLMLEIESNQIKIVATDGHRLALGSINGEYPVESTFQIIIPRKAVLELSRLLTFNEEEITISISKNHIRIQLSDIIFTSKLIDGKFPDYNRVIPMDLNQQLLINKDALKETLQRISILCNEKYRGIRLTLENNTLNIQANNPHQEEAEEEISVDFDQTKIDIGFNVIYLIDVLNVIDTDNVKIHLKDANSSCVLSNDDNEDFKYVVMPMRL